ncbi:MAG: hypothetical protein V4676_05075 [Bacteroidota bacterium]
MKSTFTLFFFCFFISLVNAQHEGHSHGAAKDTTKPPTPKPQENKTPAHDHGATGHSPSMAGHGQNNMSHAFSKNLPMNRNGSGTGWLPDNAPMYGSMKHADKWMYMLHGNVFVRYTKQDLLDKGSRGGSKFDAPNWAMLMGQRNVGRKGLVRFNVMLSLDPLTEGGAGYPLLFQTGESFNGKPLIDRQHPHDLFSELSVGYTHEISSRSDVFFYLGYPGEPALGPVAFMHRPSSLNNPDAPLTHHWVDATHITFGVATLGYRFNKWKIEASSFTGREPDEKRYNFDKPRFNSWSGRLSFNPSAKWALQTSHAFIKEPETLHPGEDVSRTTASAMYSARGFGYRFFNATAVWGMNKIKGQAPAHGALLEASAIKKRLAVFGKYEWVQKSVEELGLDEQIFGHEALFAVHALTAGVGFDLFSFGNTKVAVGTQFTFNNSDKRVSDFYGENPLGGQVYLRIYPGALGQKMGSIFLPY